ncbi:hypothetical protein A0H81_13637 [Grifola frondosa]|uniref:Uncharacterized protein n=1 Tax=Grifola frondosa TaxID=5627 RepID=A0A1C7LR43_GRIFR|nr:hypothetical protein A0H81_13637 [Grifola frondosa]
MNQTGTVCQVLFGWLDDDAAPESDLPRVHVIAPLSPHNVEYGQFDLMHLQSILELSQFLLSPTLKAYADRIKEKLLAFQNIAAHDNVAQIIAWRSDFASIDRTNAASRELASRITKWLNEVDASSPKSTTHPFDIDITSMLRDVLASPSSYAGGSSDVRTDRSDKDKFAKRSDNHPYTHDRNRFNVREWLIDQLTFTLSHNTGCDDFEGLETVYENLTTPLRLGPNVRDETPKVDPILQDACDEYFEKLKDPKFQDGVDEKILVQIRDAPSAAFYVQRMAIACLSAAVTDGATEAECRFAWDLALQALRDCWKASQPGPCISVKKERMLRLPRSMLLDKLKHGEDQKVFIELGQVAKKYFEYCQSAFQDSDSDRSSVLDEQMAAAERESVSIGQLIHLWKRQAVETRKLLDIRCGASPTQGQVDAMLTISIPGFLNEVREKLGPGVEAEALIENLTFTRRLSKSSPAPDVTITRDPIVRSSDQLAQMSADTVKSTSRSQGSRNSKVKRTSGDPKIASAKEQKESRMLMNSLYMTAVFDEVSPLNNDDDSDDASGNHLDLPLLLVEYKKKKDISETTARNQHHCPVFSMFTSGSQGVLCCAWVSHADQCVYIMERGMTGFDIATIPGAMRFITFLLRLQSHADELKRRFDEIKEDFLKLLESSEGRAKMKWTMEAQVKEYDIKLPSQQDKTEKVSTSISADIPKGAISELVGSATRQLSVASTRSKSEVSGGRHAHEAVKERSWRGSRMMRRVRTSLKVSPIPSETM